MSAFYTPEALAFLRMQEIEMEQDQNWEDIDPYIADPDEDAIFISDDDYYEYEEYYPEDIGIEGYLFGWDS